MNRPAIFNLRSWIFGLALGLFFTLVPAYGQSCALCYTQAASSGNRMIHALQNGIIILVVPPMFLSVGFTLLAYRKRNQYRDAHYPPKPKLAVRNTAARRVSNIKVVPHEH